MKTAREDTKQALLLPQTLISSTLILYILNYHGLFVEKFQVENCVIYDVFFFPKAGCKKCKQKIPKGAVRIAKVTANPFNDEGDMKLYHHPACIFETFKKARATTKIIEVPYGAVPAISILYPVELCFAK